MRRSIWVLRAQTAKEARDLVSSLSHNLGHLTVETGIGSPFRVTGRPRPLSSELEHNLLRIAHEAVTNAVRHSGARTITIGLHFDEDHLDLKVQDDGRGFEPAAGEDDGRRAECVPAHGREKRRRGVAWVRLCTPLRHEGG